MIITIKDLLIRKDNGIPICDGSIEVMIESKQFVASWSGHCIRQTTDGFTFTIKTEVPYYPIPNEVKKDA